MRDTLIHPSCYVDDNVHIGTGTRIWHFCHIMTGAVIGNHCSIGKYVEIGPGVRIGNGCKIQNHVSVYQGVTLEDDVFCGPSMVFTNVINPRAHIQRMAELKPTRVRQGATLGANCTIICGVTIGRWAMVGAGAVVTHSAADHALMTGVPARQTGWVSQYGLRLDLPLTGSAAAVCAGTGMTYVLQGATLTCLKAGGS